MSRNSGPVSPTTSLRRQLVKYMYIPITLSNTLLILMENVRKFCNSVFVLFMFRILTVASL